MGVGDGDGERVGGVGAVGHGPRQQHATMARICALSPWPAPTTVFLTAFGAYSAMVSAEQRRHQQAMPRAWPSFSVAEASRLTKVCSMAASTGESRARTSCSPSNNLPEPDAERLAVVGDDRAAGDVGEPRPVGIDDSPAGAAEARVDADDANCFASHAHVISRVGRLATIEEGEHPLPPTSGRRRRTGPRPIHRGAA